MATKETLTESRGWTWFSFDVKNWLTSKDVLSMSSSEEGLYIRLLAFQWDSSDGTIPADPVVLSKLIGRDKRSIQAFLTRYGSRLFPSVGDEAQQIAAIGGKAAQSATDGGNSLRIVADCSSLRNPKLFYLAVSKKLPCVLGEESHAQSRVEVDSNKEVKESREEQQCNAMCTSPSSTNQSIETDNNKSKDRPSDPAASDAFVTTADWLAERFNWLVAIENPFSDTKKFGKDWKSKWTREFQHMLEFYRGNEAYLVELMLFSQYNESGQQKYNLRPEALAKNLQLLEEKLTKYKQNHSDAWGARWNAWLVEVGILKQEEVEAVNQPQVPFNIEDDEQELS